MCVVVEGGISMVCQVGGRARMKAVPYLADVLYSWGNGGQVPQSDFGKVNLTLDT